MERRLDKILNYQKMKRLISYGIYLAIVLGLVFPLDSQYKILIPILLAIILFFSFLKLEYKFSHFFRKELLYYFLIGLIIIPTVVFLFTKNLPTDLRMGLFLVSITPTAIGAPIIVDLIKGNRELIVSNVVLYNILSPLTYSLLLHLFFNESQLIIPTKLIFFKLATMIFIPFILALIVRKFSKLERKLTAASQYISPISFILVIGIAVSSASLYLRELELINLLKISIFVLLLALFSFFIGSVLSKKLKIRKTLSVTFGHKNSTLTTWVALSNFAPPVVIPMILYIIFHHIINGVLIHKYANAK
jgi:BASS family bile acid:Na+ symporter